MIIYQTNKLRYRTPETARNTYSTQASQIFHVRTKTGVTQQPASSRHSNSIAASTDTTANAAMK